LGKKEQNEKKFGNWKELEDGSREYWLEVLGKSGWKAKYVKIVDINEETLKFFQAIYNEEGELVEIHEKFPIDKGHSKFKK